MARKAEHASPFFQAVWGVRACVAFGGFLTQVAMVRRGEYSILPACEGRSRRIPQRRVTEASPNPAALGEFSAVGVKFRAIWHPFFRAIWHAPRKRACDVSRLRVSLSCIDTAVLITDFVRHWHRNAQPLHYPSHADFSDASPSRRFSRAIRRSHSEGDSSAGRSAASMPADHA